METHITGIDKEDVTMKGTSLHVVSVKVLVEKFGVTNPQTLTSLLVSLSQTLQIFQRMFKKITLSFRYNSLNMVILK